VVSIVVGEKIRGKLIKDVICLSNGWYVIKTADGKSPRDFRVKVIFQTHPSRSLTPKHAHFVIDLYGKLCADPSKGRAVLDAIVEVWRGRPVEEVLRSYQGRVMGLPGYPLEYILHALNWILEQEDVNFTKRPEKKQQEIDQVLSRFGVSQGAHRLGSQLALSLLCDVANGTHPVEALIKANLDILPSKRAKGAV